MANELVNGLDDIRLSGSEHADGGIDECEEAITSTSDSEESLSEPVRYGQMLDSTCSDMSSVTLTPRSCDGADGDGFVPRYGMNDDDFSHFQVPIVGYEVMEERARFTVYKLRIENKATGDCWYVFRRYTDFVRLCNRMKRKFPEIVKHLPRKRWLGNNFDPVFLDERINGLQTLVNAVLANSSLVQSQQIQDFFCLNEPPVYSETNEESRAMFEALEDTIYQLKQQICEKDSIIDNLQDSLHSKNVENDNLRKALSNATVTCQTCNNETETK